MNIKYTSPNTYTIFFIISVHRKSMHYAMPLSIITLHSGIFKIRSFWFLIIIFDKLVHRWSKSNCNYEYVLIKYEDYRCDNTLPSLFGIDIVTVPHLIDVLYEEYNYDDDNSVDHVLHHVGVYTWFSCVALSYCQLLQHSLNAIQFFTLF